MPHDRNQPPETIVEAEPPPAEDWYQLFERRPTWRDRLRTGRWLGLKIDDWAAVLGLGLAAGGFTLWTITLIPRTKPELAPILVIALALESLSLGALLAYTLVHRLLGRAAAGLITLNERSLDSSRTLIAEVRTLIATAYAAGRLGERSTWESATASAQATIAALERELADRRPHPLLALPDPDRRAMSERLADLERHIAEIQASDLPDRADQIQIELDHLLTETQELSEAVASENERRLAQLDATDKQILALLAADPTMSDEEIGDEVGLSITVVLRRRKHMVALGIREAEKRQGQRPRRKR